MRTQMLGYSRVFDEDAGERTEEFSTSKVGVRGYDTTYPWRTLKLDLAYIGPRSTTPPRACCARSSGAELSRSSA
jgi:hypothetical protein